MIDWQQVDTVLLDMDGTLLDLHFDNYFWLQHIPERYAAQHDLTPDAAREALLSQYRQQEGSLNWYCLDFWSRALNLDILSLKREIEHKIQFRPRVKDFLKAVKGEGKSLMIVTNAHQDSIALKLEKTQLHHWVDGVLCSHDFRYPKEHPEFWHALQAGHPFDPQRTLFIDDSLPVLRAARDYGIRYLLSIAQPDSQQPSRTTAEFTGLDCFSQITPQTRAPHDRD